MKEFAVHNQDILQPNIRFQQCISIKVRVKIKTGFKIVPLSELLYVEAYTPYTYLHLSDGTKIFCGDPIRYFESKLSQHGFLRVHKSIIVNICEVESYNKEGEGSLTLKTGIEINLARGKKQKVLAMLENQFL